MERIDGRKLWREYPEYVVFRETFTGDGATKTFTLDGTIGNATFRGTIWNLNLVQATYPSHITNTSNRAIYDSIIPLSRNRVGVSAINADSGVVTLDYAPRNDVSFYVWYWYALPTHGLLEEYFREDFVASMEEVAGGYAEDTATTTTDFGGVLSGADTTVQKALDTIDDHGHAHNSLSSPDGGTAGEYYHLTSSEYTELNAWLDDVTLGDGGAVGCGTVTTTVDFVLPDGGALRVADSDPQIILDNTNGYVEITGKVGIGVADPEVELEVNGSILIPNGQSYRLETSAGANGVGLWAGGTDYLNVGNDNCWSGIKFLPGTAVKMTLLANGRLGVGLVNPAAKLHIDQATADAAIPVLALDQADIDQDMIEFICAIGEGNALEAIGTKVLTTTHFIKVTLPGALTRYIPCGTIATP